MIQRYGLGREYAGNTGSPAITEQADGAYVRYDDHAAIIGEFQAEKAALESIVAAQAGVIAKNGRLLIACEAHNEMLIGRLKLAEGAPVGTLINKGTKSAQPDHSEDARHLAEPSDDELAALWDKIHALFGREPFRIGHVDFARALLAKYGSKP